ncbi:MAG: winged helix DNA-binding domain-containing protein [Acidobacteriota bacterium]
MSRTDDLLIRRRLASQQLVSSRFLAPAQLVAWMTAVQAQDFAGAKWGVGMRVPGAREADIDALFDAGAILRTHVLRPTWHFVAPADIRWMLMLTGPRVLATCAPYCRKLEIDAAVLKKSRPVLERAMRDNAFKTRTELGHALGRNGIVATGVRLGFLMMDAELNAQVCSGPRRGKQFTYALIDERAPRAASLTRDEALAELARRYFDSHGPATLRDFSWWSGLLMKDGQRGVDALDGALMKKEIGDRVYWSPRESRTAASFDEAYLLPNYDEYLIAYKDRDPVVPPAAARLASGVPGGEVFAHQIVLSGRLAGAWRRTVSSRRMLVDGRAYRPISVSERRALTRAATRYADFLQVPVECVVD